MIDRAESENEDDIYKLIRGTPSFVVTRSAETKLLNTDLRGAPSDMVSS